VRALFEQALALRADERATLFADPALDAALVAEVRSLLEHHAAATALDVDRPAFVPLAETPEPTRQGQRLGAWRIVSALGRGGMGEVWLAERSDGAWRGEAAIKVLRRGMDSGSVLARFALEQQALARLTHPHIARLLDAGRTEDGLPYFVMERVRGRPIDAACEGKPLAERLHLFLQLADAVAHAHRNLLVHRDLKPSNVLVDDNGQVKLLDFGIAKALDPLEADDAGQTVAAERPLTPHYASPEQVRGEPVTTATDLYSLGVLLYVMLTGQRPYGRGATTPAAAVRSVLEEAPSRPSSLALPQPGWGRTRRELQGDLDNILLKALEKSVDERYPAVDALAADVRAYLEGRPVSARAPSAGYLLGKFVRRHRWAALAAALGALGLVAGLAATLLQGRVVMALGLGALAAGLTLALVQARAAALARDAAAAARDQAQRRLTQIKRIMSELVFRYGDTVLLLPGGAKAQLQMLEQAVSALEPALCAAPDDEELIATMVCALGRMAEIQGNTTLVAAERIGAAAPAVARVEALAERIWARRLTDWRFVSWLQRTLVVKARLLRGEGDLEAAAQVLARAAARGDTALERQTDAEGRLYVQANIALTRLLLAQVYDHGNFASLSRPAEALQQLALAEDSLRSMLQQRDLMAAMDSASAPGDAQTEVSVLHDLAVLLGSRALVHLRQEALEPARAELEEAVRLHRVSVEREPHYAGWRDGLMTESNSLALVLLRLGEPQAALEHSTRAWEVAHALAKDEGPQSKWAASPPVLALQHGRALTAVGRVAEAVSMLEASVAHFETQRDESALVQRRRAQSHQLLAAALARRGGEGARAAAVAHARAALSVLRPLAAQGQPQRRDALRLLGATHALLAHELHEDEAAHRAAAIEALRAAQSLYRLGSDDESLLAELLAAGDGSAR
jgi:tetratricopeptide (TPR) repeat protein